MRILKFEKTVNLGDVVVLEKSALLILGIIMLSGILFRLAPVLTTVDNFDRDLPVPFRSCGNDELRSSHLPMLLITTRADLSFLRDNS